LGTAEADGEHVPVRVDAVLVDRAQRAGAALDPREEQAEPLELAEEGGRVRARGSKERRVDLREEHDVLRAPERLPHPVEREGLSPLDVQLHEQAAFQVVASELLVEARRLHRFDGTGVLAREERAAERAAGDVEVGLPGRRRERTPAQARPAAGELPDVEGERGEVVGVRLEGQDVAPRADGTCREHGVGAEVGAAVDDGEARLQGLHEEADVRRPAARAVREEAPVTQVAAEREPLDAASERRLSESEEGSVAAVADDVEGPPEPGRTGCARDLSEPGQHHPLPRHQRPNS